MNDQPKPTEWTADMVKIRCHNGDWQFCADSINAALAVEERRANDSIEENVRLMNRLAAEREAGKWLGELLAVIHCDGGHYQYAHGTEKATKDAIQKRTAMVMRIDELETQLAAEREKVLGLHMACRAERAGAVEAEQQLDAEREKVVALYAQLIGYRGTAASGGTP